MEFQFLKGVEAGLTLHQLGVFVQNTLQVLLENVAGLDFPQNHNIRVSVLCVLFWLEASLVYNLEDVFLAFFQLFDQLISRGDDDHVVFAEELSELVGSILLFSS